MENEKYYASANPVLLNAIPPSAKKILDVGCGTGALGLFAKQKIPGIVCFGIEFNPDAARIAKNNLDHAICANIELDELSLEKEAFDCILFGDVLEHLYNPLAALQKLRVHLKADGSILCSVPNAQHYSIIESLLSGDFQYQEMGLLDKTHIRFFTYSSFIKLLLDAGFIPTIPSTTTIYRNPAFIESLTGSMNYLKQDSWRFTNYLSIFQYLFKGTKNPAYSDTPSPPFPISFIIPTNNKRLIENYISCSPVFKENHPH